MKIRTYEYFVIGVKYPGDTQFSIFREPYLAYEAAEAEARNHAGIGREVAIFRQTMIMKFEPDYPAE